MADFLNCPVIVLNCNIVDPDKVAANIDHNIQTVLPSGSKCSKHENFVVCKCSVHEVSKNASLFN